MFGKLPWITEENIWRGLPKTSRIPTGGWRGYGAVPSHSYPAPSTLPDGYWQGLGACASTFHPAAQGAKTNLSGFGEISAPTAESLRLQAAKARDAGRTAEAAALEAQATELEKKASSQASAQAWSDALVAIAKAGSTAYATKLRYDAQREAIKAGAVPVGTPIAPTQQPALMQPGTMRPGVNPMVLIGLLGLGVGAVVLLS